MMTTNVIRIYRYIAAATRSAARAITVHRQQRRWRRSVLRALRQRSRE